MAHTVNTANTRPASAACLPPLRTRRLGCAIPLAVKLGLFAGNGILPAAMLRGLDGVYPPECSPTRELDKGELCVARIVFGHRATDTHHRSRAMREAQEKCPLGSPRQETGNAALR